MIWKHCCTSALLLLSPKSMTRLCTLLIFFSLFFSISSSAQTGNITGKITDEGNNQTLVGSTIMIVENSKKTVTESDGAYKFRDIPVGKYTLQVNYVGYDSKRIAD